MFPFNFIIKVLRIVQDGKICQIWYLKGNIYKNLLLKHVSGLVTPSKCLAPLQGLSFKAACASERGFCEDSKNGLETALVSKLSELRAFKVLQILPEKVVKMCRKGVTNRDFGHFYKLLQNTTNIISL